MSTGKKLTIGFTVTLFLYGIFSVVLFNTIYNEWDYFIFQGKIFLFDIVRYLSFTLGLAAAIYIVGIKYEWKIIMIMLIAQIIGFGITYYSIYQYSGKAHFIDDMQGGVISIYHNSFLEWLDYLIGIRRWGYTRALELIIFTCVVYSVLRIPKPKWTLLNRSVHNST